MQINGPNFNDPIGEMHISEELKIYMANAFLPGPEVFAKLPLADEEFVESWNSYFRESKTKGVLPTLKARLPQLNFPIEKGVGASEEYRMAVTAQKSVEEISNKSGFVLSEADKVELFIHKTAAGSIPVIVVRNRGDFEQLYRAIAFKNEPVEIPASVGACAISGYNNCERLAAYRNKRLLEDPFGISALADSQSQKSFYQDRFLLLSDGPYSGIPASSLGFDEGYWRARSLEIRLGHESAHYFTRRCLGSMRNNAHDELIADYAGLCRAFGSYESSLFLKFCGLEKYPEISPNGRIQNYKGTPPLACEDFKTMCAILRAASLTLEAFDKKHRAGFNRGDFTVAAILCAASLSIYEMACKNGLEALEKALMAL